MKVVEMFASVQGEGLFLGTPVIFIRLAGCNLNCPFCDTEWKEGTEMTINDIHEELKKYPQIKIVVITGGEPTIHQGFETLCKNLHLWGYQINVETNGTSQITHKHVDWITCSPKAVANYDCRAEADEIKLVVTPEFDIEDPRIKALAIFHTTIWLQPEGSQMQEMWKKCNDIALKDSHYRVGVQLHKLMEVR